MSMTDRERAARDIGFLEGFGATVWAMVGEKLADEYAAYYDSCVDGLRKMIFGAYEDSMGDEDE